MKNKYLSKIEKGIRNVAIVYVLLGSIYSCGKDTTGHLSSDIYLGKTEPTKLEKSLVEILEPIFQ